MKIFSEEELSKISDLYAMVSDLCKILEEMSVDKKLYNEIISVKDILQRKDSHKIESISSLLYSDLKSLDQNNVYNDKIDLLTHKVYSFSVAHSVFSGGDLSKNDSVSEIIDASMVIRFINISDDSRWKTLEGKDDFLKFITPLGGYDLMPLDTDVKILKLPFYKNVELINIKHGVGDDYYFNAYFVKHANGYIYCDENISSIDELSKFEQPFITKDNILDYIKFFTFFTVEDGERSYLIEGNNSEFLVGLSEYEKGRYLEDFKNIAVKKLKNPDRYEICYREVSDEGLCDTTFEVSPSGDLDYKDLEYISDIKAFTW